MNELITITKDELTKSGTSVLNAAQLDFLLGKTPANHIYKRPAKGGGEWSYVTGVYVKKVLNLCFGWDWSFEIVEHKFDLNIKQAYVLGKLTVHSQGRDIVKMQFGRVDIKFKTAWENGKKIQTDQPLDIGNVLKAASTDALKKCASELGIASDVYAPNEFEAIRVAEKMETTDMVEEIEKLLESNTTLSQDDRMYIEMTLEKGNEKEFAKILKKLR